MLDDYNIDLSFNIRHRVGGDLVRYPVCFSQDESSFLTSTGSTVKIFNTHTGALLGVLRGHTARVTGVFLNPANDLQVYTTSHDGTIRRWDMNECVCLQVYDVGIPILRGSMGSGHHMYLALNPHHYAALDTSHNQAKAGKGDQKQQQAQVHGNQSQQHSGNDSYRPFSISSFYLGTSSSSSSSSSQTSITPSDPSQEQQPKPATTITIADHSSHLETLFTLASFTDLSRSHSHELLCAVSGNELHVYSKTSRVHGVVYHGRRITCVAVHPKQDVVAIGDTSGRITLYLNLSTTAGSSLEGSHSTVFRWHSSSVSSIAFTPDGTYLLSGGNEAVLVFWNLSTGQSHFLPRLGHIIQHISVSPRGGVYAASCANNSIQLISAIASQKKNSVYGCDLMSSNNQLNVVYAHQKDYISLIGEDGNIQIFDCESDAHFTSIDINNENYLQERRTPILKHVAMSDDGAWTITAHSGVPGATGPCLRFWSRPTSVKSSTGHDSSYYLDIGDDTQSSSNPTADLSPATDAYGNQLTTPLEASNYNTKQLANSKDHLRPVPFSPSTSKPHTLKTPLILQTLWNDPEEHEIVSIAYSNANTAVITGHSDGKVRVWVQDRKQWSTSHTFTYHGMIPNMMTFSHDNSLLAIGFNNTLTLWKVEPKTMNLTFIYSHGFAGKTTIITALSFIRTLPLLYVGTPHGVYCFDLLSLTCRSFHPCMLAGMIAHPMIPLVVAVAVLPYKKDEASSHLLNKPTRECSILVWKGESIEPMTVTTIDDVLLTKEKGQDNRNIYLQSAYETSIALTPNFFVYLNRSREIGVIPYTLLGIHLIQQESTQYTKHTFQKVYKSLSNIYQIGMDSKMLQQRAIELFNEQAQQYNNLKPENKVAIDRVCNTLSNIPSHTLPSLSLIFDQFMTAFACPPL